MKWCASIAISAALGLLASPAALAQDEPSAAPDAVESLKTEAAALAALVESASVKDLLRATEALPQPEARTIYRTPDRSAAYTEAEAAVLTDEARADLTPRECDARFYYYTGYGTPLVYARPLDIVARIWEAEAPEANAFAGKRIFDFGYGSIGHLRLLASRGAECVGAEVEPLFRALYSFPGDQGAMEGFAGAPDGKVTLLHGRWPAEDKIREAVGTGYDLIISKNVLKRGYIHPAREVNERFLVKLGVDDGSFVRAVHDALAPGGLFFIYNISPAQNPEGQPYLPHADGQCPFPREMLETAGLEVLEFDRVDTDAILGFWAALGYDEGKPAENLRKELFAWYTLVRRRG